jgi:NADP-dependent 3-hydroxy acid dehydrogenase YdfG
MYKTVLITGTTSGLGKALLVHYASLGAKVIAVNRRKTYELNDWDIEEHVIDITDYENVFALLRDLKGREVLPDLFILNAGINMIDNLSGLDFRIFSDVMRINLNGVMTFVGAIRELGIMEKTISAISSTSNIVPNPAHISYAVSKRALHESFKLLGKNDRANRYQSVVLSPVLTNIMMGYPKPTGLKAKVLEGLAVPADHAASALASFFASKRSVFYYTKGACLFYFLVRIALKFFPGAYRGTTLSTQSPWMTRQPGS